MLVHVLCVGQSDALDGPEDNESDGSLTPKPTEELPLVPGDRKSPNKTKRAPTTPAEKVEDRTPTSPAEKTEDCTPSPTVEKIKDRTPSPPPTEQEKEYTPPEQPYEDYTMSYPYPKYRDDPNAEVHVYTFLQT